MVPIFVRLVPVNITRPATHALGALLVLMGSMKQPLAAKLKIAFVLKKFVFAPVALQQQVEHVTPTVLLFVRLVQSINTMLSRPGHAVYALRVVVDFT